MNKLCRNVFSFLKEKYKIVSAIALNVFSFLKKKCKIVSTIALNVFSFLKEKRKIALPIAFAVLSVVCVVISAIASGVTVAYSVEYGGEKIALVETVEVFQKGSEMALSKVKGQKENLIYTPKFKKVLTIEKNINTAEEVSVGIIDNTAEIKKAILIKVNGEDKLYIQSKQEIDALLDERLKAYDVATADENISEFVDKIEFTEVYCAASSLCNAEKIKTEISNLKVKTTIKYNEDVVLKYKTITKYDSNKLYTYRQTTREGANGVGHNVDMVVFINGIESSREHIEQQVIKAPVDKIVVVGTQYKKDTVASAQGMICPLPRGSYAITSKYGEKRGSSRHYALDLGTYGGAKQPIYAVKDGVVTKAVKSNTGYGYHVVIDHGAGVETLYAHASALYVSKGDKVTQGQMIAKVGSTGNSTGPHLHFEVIINGTKKDPNNYIKF